MLTLNKIIVWLSFLKTPSGCNLVYQSFLQNFSGKDIFWKKPVEQQQLDLSPDKGSLFIHSQSLNVLFLYLNR